jgi:iron complex outermembrane receptor protein
MVEGGNNRTARAALEAAPSRAIGREAATFRAVVALLLCAGLSKGSQQRLAELGLEQLGNIEVTTSSKEPEEVWKTPAAIYVLTQEDIRRSGATSIPEVLRLVPGVEVARVDSDHWSVAIRGFGSTFSKDVLVLIDGRSVYTPLFAGVYWDVQNLMIEDVDRIEVIRGPGGTIWGPNAVNGVINIITKRAKDTHGALATAGGGSVDRGAGAFRWGGGNGKGFDYRGYGMGFDVGPEFHQDRENFDPWGMGQAGFRMDWSQARDALTLQGDFYKGEEGEQVGEGVYSPPGQITVNGSGHVSGGDLVAHWRRTFSSGSDIEVVGYYDRTYRLGPQLGEARNTYDLDFIHHLTLPRQNFIWGLGARLSPSDFIQLIPTADFLPHHQTDRIYSGFLQDEVTLVPNRLSVTLGAKFEDNNYSGFGVEPSARLLWTPTPHQTFWAAFTRALRTPSRIDDDLQLTGFFENVNGFPVFIRISGDPNFKPEVLSGYEVGYRTLVTSKLYLDVAAFHNDYKNLLSYGTGSALLESAPPPLRVVLDIPYANVDRASTNGFEIGPEWKPVSWWQVKTSWAYLNLKAGGLDPGFAASYEGSSPRNQVTVQSLLNLPKKFEFDQTYRQVSALPAQTSSNILPVEVVKAYGTADARLGWRPTPHVELSIAGDNLLQPHHAEFGDSGPLIGIKRSVYGKAVFRW